jgi:acyl-CoA thioesterase FadM
MNVRYYAALFDEAGWHIPSFAGLSLAEIQSRGLGTVVASLNIDILHENRARQQVHIKGAVTRVGTKSFNHEMRLYASDTMTHCATQKTVEVCFDTKARKGVALPDDVRTKLTTIVNSGSGS